MRYMIGNMKTFYSDSNYSSSSKINQLKEYFTFDKKKLMSRSEVRLYEWILKKQYNMRHKDLFNWEEVTLNGMVFHIQTYAGEYLVYLPNFKSIMDEKVKFDKQQNKYRARHHGKMGR
jgi:hypothetical protein